MAHPRKLGRQLLRPWRSLVLALAVGLGLQAAAPAPALARKSTAVSSATRGRKASAAKAPQKISLSEVSGLMGRDVYLAIGASTPLSMLRVMREAALSREGRTNVYMLSTFAGKSNFTPDVTAKWHPNLFFISGNAREAATNAHKGQATLHRASLFELSKRIERSRYKFDTIIVRVSPPDADGMVSLGVAGDLTLPALRNVLRNGGKVIAEINKNVPHTRGNRIRFSQLSAYVENDEALPELPAQAPALIDQKIATHVARLIPNRRRSTLQVGIGQALNALGGSIQNKRLALWSEMGGEWLVPLMTPHARTNKNGKTKSYTAIKGGVVSFLLGSNQLYDLARQNPNLEVHTTTEVNDPKVVAQQKRMRAINTALQVDIEGNANAEQIGSRIISAPGGQPDFMKGASGSKDGRSIMALRSIHEESGASSIVLGLDGPKTTEARFVDHLVTEWGATKLMRGLPQDKRTYEIIRVAHPLHRQGLAEVALKRGIISQPQYDKLVRSVGHSIRLSDSSTRTTLANQAFEKGLLTQPERDALVASTTGATP